jgi:hypothetical protein
MSAVKTWPMTSDVRAVIPAYPLKISIRSIARALKTEGDRDHALMNRIRRRLKEACRQGSVIKQERFGNAVYWRPVETEGQQGFPKGKHQNALDRWSDDADRAFEIC